VSAYVCDCGIDWRDVITVTPVLCEICKERLVCEECWVRCFNDEDEEVFACEHCAKGRERP
jgi:hypothetical protein